MEGLRVNSKNYSDGNGMPQLYPAIQVKLDGLPAVQCTTRWWPGVCQSSHPKAGGPVWSVVVSVIDGPNVLFISLSYKSKNCKKRLMGFNVA